MTDPVQASVARHRPMAPAARRMTRPRLWVRGVLRMLVLREQDRLPSASDDSLPALGRSRIRDRGLYVRPRPAGSSPVASRPAGGLLFRLSRGRVLRAAMFQLTDQAIDAVALDDGVEVGTARGGQADAVNDHVDNP